MNLFADLSHLLIFLRIMPEITNPFAWMWIILFSAFMIYVFIISPIIDYANKKLFPSRKTRIRHFQDF